MLRHKKFLFILAVLFSSVARSEDLQPLSKYTMRHPLFMSDVSDAQMIASRCSALFLILSTRSGEIKNKESIKDVIKHFAEKAEGYELTRLLLTKGSSSEGIKTRLLEKRFAKKYAEITLYNWKKSNDLFGGLIDQDRLTCEDHYPYFKKLNRNLAQALKH